MKNGITTISGWISVLTGLLQQLIVLGVIVGILFGDVFGVKASGGIQSFDDLLSMIQAGANRIGTSSGTKIIKEINAD